MTLTFLGSWSDADRAAALEGVRALSDALSEITGTDDAFYRLFGDVTFEARKSLPGRYHGYVVAGNAHRILFRIGKVTPRLVIHELGHLCNDNVPEEQSPAHLLSVYGVKVGNKLVTGPGADGYQRHAGRYPPHNGYLHYGYPWQIHPRKWVDGNTCVEDWSDMLLAWVMGEFAPNEPGDALNGWVSDYLVGRLA
jgi:hypothetical protein